MLTSRYIGESLKIQTSPEDDCAVITVAVEEIVGDRVVLNVDVNNVNQERREKIFKDIKQKDKTL